jgi:hypothetical protein
VSSGPAVSQVWQDRAMALRLGVLALGIVVACASKPPLPPCNTVDISQGIECLAVEVVPCGVSALDPPSHPCHEPLEDLCHRFRGRESPCRPFEEPHADDCALVSSGVGRDFTLDICGTYRRLTWTDPMSIDCNGEGWYDAHGTLVAAVEIGCGNHHCTDLSTSKYVVYGELPTCTITETRRGCPCTRRLYE